MMLNPFIGVSRICDSAFKSHSVGTTPPEWNAFQHLVVESPPWVLLEICPQSRPEERVGGSWFWCIGVSPSAYGGAEEQII